MSAEVRRSEPAARRVTHRQAALLLAARDPVVAGLVREAGPPRFPRSRETPFEAMVRSVVFQQLAGAAARAIHARVVAALEGETTPQRVLAADAAVLRACGLSGRKVETLHELAARTVDGSVVLDPRRLARLTDAEIIAGLSAVRGIGPWSAQMLLMFQLRRLDVWPVGDLAVRKGYGLAWQVTTPTPKQLDGLGGLYRPYRSVAAWYCWKAQELYSGRAPALPTDT